MLDGERAVSLGSGRHPTLLTCLLLSANEVVSRDLLIDALWGARPPATAANALQVQVHGLRKRLGQERVVTERPGYRLRVEPGELDAERFEGLVDRGRAERAADETTVAAATLREALALWRGPALADVAYEAFAQAEIGRLEELRLVALEERLDADLALARHVELVAELEALAAEHPLRERIQAQLMLALYRSGRQTDALAVFRRGRRELRETLGLEPGPELRELHQAILRHDPALRLEPPELRGRRHLPAPPTRLVGRRRELAEIDELLRGETRLLTLTGPGGIGKTRLAVQAAHDLADAFADGVYFVDVAPMREPELVPSAIAQSLGVEERTHEPLLETLGSYLRDRRLLLLVDNFETVDEAAPVLAQLLSLAPELELLVTSRMPLRVLAEHEYRVHPLPLPDASRLFAERARAVSPVAHRPSEEADEVAEICRRLDCLPLAIELAAAQTRNHSAVEMLELLPSRFELAAEGPRDLPERQRTLRATIDWSHELLSPDGQALLARMAVFTGGCTLPAASAVCGANRGQLASLVVAALLYEHLGADGELRLSMLETVREYALERLESRGEADAVGARHATYFAELAEAADEDATASGDSAWPRLDEEHENLRAAIDWTREAGAVDAELRLVGALAVFWAVRGHLREGAARVAAALSHAADAPLALRAKVLGGASWIALRSGDYDEAEARAAESLAACRELGDGAGVALALNRLGAAVSNQGDVARAIDLQKQSALVYRRLGDDRGLAVVLSNLGYRLLIQGDHEQARLLCEESLTLLRGLGDRGSITLPLVNLGLVALLQDRTSDALALFREGLQLSDELGFVTPLIHCLHGVAAVLAATGDVREAVTIIAASEAVAKATGVSVEPFERRIHDRTLEALTNVLERDAFAIAYETGRRLAREDAVAYALAGAERRASAQATPA